MMPDTDHDGTASSGPYGDHALRYHAAGWQPLPVPAGKKTWPPKGYTGADGAVPSGADVYAWTEDKPDSNIALRLPPHVIGIDVDHYDAKPGAAMLADLEARLGALPTTWRTTSRDDGVSGIRLYRVPPGLRWPGGLGPGIDTIRYDHRYAMAWPSIHPNGGTYRWITPDGVTALSDIPNPDALPDLPNAWVEHFTRNELSTEQPHAGLDTAEAGAWMAQNGAGFPCDRVADALQRGLADLTTAASGGRHDTVLRLTNRLAWLSAEGHPGLTYALDAVTTAWMSAVAADRGPEDARAELARMIHGAIDIAAAAHQDKNGTDPCKDPFNSIHGILSTTTTAAMSTGAGAATSTTTMPSSTATDATSPTASEPTTSSSLEDTNSVDNAADTLSSAQREVLSRLRPGGGFILDIPDKVPSVWGDRESVLWAEGEALTICGPPGVGKTTLTGQVVRARLVGGQVLGLSVRQTESKVLYLAMDRPRQIARALRRTLADLGREILDDRLVFWPGPPIADVAAHPSTLLGLVQLAGADTVIIDSIKDAAVGLSSDEVGAGYNRARQMCIAAGVEVLELHHMVKKGDGGSAPTSLADLYGSVWISAGAGSVLLLHGSAGDPIVQMSHLKTPAEEVGPYRLRHDHDLGVTEIFHSTDILGMARLNGVRGITAKAVAQATEEKDNPSHNAIEKARRRLEKLVRDGHLTRTGGEKGGAPAVYHYVEDAVEAIAPGSNHESRSNHDRDSCVTLHDPLTQITHEDVSAGQSNHASNHANHAPSNHVPLPPLEGGGDVSAAPQRPRLVERVIGGERVRFNLDTGQVER